jgi:hypothetical protein
MRISMGEFGPGHPWRSERLYQAAHQGVNKPFSGTNRPPTFFRKYKELDEKEGLVGLSLCARGVSRGL